MEKVCKIEVKGDLRSSIEEAVEGLGGFGRFFKRGEVVLVKPNFNTADPFPASTDLEFLREIVSLIYEEGVKSVIVGESSTYSRNTRSEMGKLGVFDLENEDHSPKIHVFEERGWVKKEIPGGRHLKSASVPEILDSVDKLVLLPCLKTHKYAKFTGSLKLSLGFLKPIERIPLHLKDLQGKIADLNRIISPDLVIMDGRKCFINGGPSKGEVREPGLIMASTDRVAVDVEGIKVIQGFEGNSLVGIDPLELPQIKLFMEDR